MNPTIDRSARKRLATLVRRLAAGVITNHQFESECPQSDDPAIHSIYCCGLWLLYDDFVEHKLVGQWALNRRQRTHVARIVLFLLSGLPYRYPRITVFDRLWHHRQWRAGDESIWPFYSRSEYEATLQNPVFMRATTPAPPPSPARQTKTNR